MELEKYIEELRSLVNIDCGTQTREGLAEVAEIMCKFWQQEGWHTDTVDLGSAVGPGLFVTYKPATEQFDVLLVGHLDTVFPVGTVAERPMGRDEIRLYGPGVSDMKSGLLNILWAIRSLATEHHKRLSIAIAIAIAIAMNLDEETGSIHSHEWIGALAKRARCVLVCEAARADGSLVNARTGVYAGSPPQWGALPAH
jgi:glutamate carboxypeptidase